METEKEPWQTPLYKGSHNMWWQFSLPVLTSPLHSKPMNTQSLAQRAALLRSLPQLGRSWSLLVPIVTCIRWYFNHVMFLHKTEFCRGACGLPACPRSPVIPEQYKVPRGTFIAVTSIPGLLFHFLIFHSFLTLPLYPKLSISFSFLKDFPLAPSDHWWPWGLLSVSATKLSLRIISFSVFYSIW